MDCLGVLLQKIFDNKATLTIKGLTSVSQAKSKAVYEGNIGEITLNDLKTPLVRANSG